MLGEVFKLFGTIGLNNKEANDGIDETTGNAKKASSKIADFFKKAAVAIGTAFAAKKLIDFGKLAVEAAAGAQAMQAQFEQVFSDLSGQAQKSMDEIAKETGMLPNRLKPSFTQMAAFAKTTGMETADALSLTERATMAAADSAAFYDKSIEQVTENLQSFLKGNYENDAALGISATETTRNAKANELYGKSFNKLSESQKQLTLLAMVEDGNKLSGALGQAARESDSLENQTGNLKQAWQDFLAVIGGPILAPVVAGLTTLSSWLTIAGDKVQDFQKWFGGALEEFKKTEAWQMITGAIQMVVDKFNEFKNSFSNIKESVLSSGVIETIKGYIAGIVTFWTGIFSGEGNLGQTFIRIFNTIKDVAMPILMDAMNFIKGIISQLTAFWNENGQQIVQAVKSAFGFIASVIGFIMPFVEAIIVSVWGNIKGVIQGALNIILGLIKVFSGIFTGDWSNVWEGIKQLVSGALQFIWNLVNLMLFKNLLTGIKSFGKNLLGGVKTWFSNLQNGVKTSFSSISNLWNSLRTGITNIANGLKNGVTSAFTTLKNTVTNIWNGIKTAMTKPIQTAKNVISGIIDKIKGLFNFTWKLPKLQLPRFSIKPSGWKIGDLLKGTIPTLGIDWYAKGGIMTDPTVFGFNGRNAMVGGEAGPEAILPLNDETLGAIGKGIAANMSNNRPIVLQIDGKTFAQIIGDYTDQEGGTRIRHIDRGLA